MQNGNEKKNKKKTDNLNQDSKLKKKTEQNNNKSLIFTAEVHVLCFEPESGLRVILVVMFRALNSFRCIFCAFTLFVAFFFVYLFLAVGY